MTKPRKRSKPSSIFPPSLVFLLLTMAGVVMELWRELPIAPGNLIRIVVGPVLILLRFLASHENHCWQIHAAPMFRS